MWLSRFRHHQRLGRPHLAFGVISRTSSCQHHGAVTLRTKVSSDPTFAGYLTGSDRIAVSESQRHFNCYFRSTTSPDSWAFVSSASASANSAAAATYGIPLSPPLWLQAEMRGTSLRCLGCCFSHVLRPPNRTRDLSTLGGLVSRESRVVTAQRPSSGKRQNMLIIISLKGRSEFCRTSNHRFLRSLNAPLFVSSVPHTSME